MWKSTYEAWSCQEDFYLRWFYTKSEVCFIIKRTILYARFRIIWRQVVYIVCLLVQVCTKFNLVSPRLNLQHSTWGLIKTFNGHLMTHDIYYLGTTIHASMAVGTEAYERFWNDYFNVNNSDNKLIGYELGTRVNHVRDSNGNLKPVWLQTSLYMWTRVQRPLLR